MTAFVGGMIVGSMEQIKLSRCDLFFSGVSGWWFFVLQYAVCVQINVFQGIIQWRIVFESLESRPFAGIVPSVPTPPIAISIRVVVTSVLVVDVHFNLP